MLKFFYIQHIKEVMIRYFQMLTLAAHLRIRPRCHF